MVVVSKGLPEWVLSQSVHPNRYTEKDSEWSFFVAVLPPVRAMLVRAFHKSDVSS